MDQSKAERILGRVETKCGGYPDADIRVAWKDLKERVEQLREATSSTHYTSPSGVDTIRFYKRKAKEALQRLRKEAKGEFVTLGTDLGELRREIEDVDASYV